MHYKEFKECIPAYSKCNVTIVIVVCYKFVIIKRYGIFLITSSSIILFTSVKYSLSFNRLLLNFHKPFPLINLFRITSRSIIEGSEW